MNYDIEMDGLDFIALDHTGNEIGRFTINENEGEWPSVTYELIEMSVDHNYQRQGIGSALLHAAFETYPSLVLPQDYDGSCKASEISNPLTEQGRSFIFAYKKKNDNSDPQD